MIDGSWPSPARPGYSGLKRDGAARERKPRTDIDLPYRPCPVCGADAYTEQYRSERPDGVYTVTVWRCPNNARKLTRRELLADKKPRPNTHPAHRTEERTHEVPKLDTAPRRCEKAFSTRPSRPKAEPKPRPEPKPNPMAVRGHRRRKEILEFIESYQRQHGFGPSIREIGEAVGLSSSCTVWVHLRAMEQAGQIQRANGRARCLSIPDTEVMRFRAALLLLRDLVGERAPWEQLEQVILEAGL